MSKKFWIPIIAVSLVALAAGAWLYAGAAAQDSQEPARALQARRQALPRLLGQVTAVAPDQFTVQTRAGQERTFRIDETTRFVDPQKQPLSPGDLSTGGWVAVVAARWSGQPPLARLVVILPQDFDPADWSVARGHVTTVDQAGNSFKLEDKNGKAITIKVDASTKYRGQVTGLTDLQPGMLAQAVTEKQADGGLLARTVRAGFPPDRRFLGKVTEVGAQSFTIQTRRGEALTFQVTGDTHFRSRSGAVDSLDDLKAGMPVAVGAQDLGNGQYQALVVRAAPNLKIP